MIARLSGILAEKETERIIVDVDGVGYEVRVPLSTFYELGEEGDSIVLRIHTHVTESSLSLYGFLTERERSLFLLLIQISGIGPKLASTILSGLPVDEFVKATSQGDLVRLNRIPGVGKKTAERMVLELKGKLDGLMADPAGQVDVPIGSTQSDVVSALVNLGYPRNKAERAVARAAESHPEERLEGLLRASLKVLAG